MEVWGDGVRSKAIAMMVALLFLTSCDDSPQGPTTQDFSREREALAARVKAKKPAEVAAQQAVAQAPAEAAFGGYADNFSYDRTGMRDPFRSFEWEEKSRAAMDLADRGPLEQYDVNQLSLLAVVWNTGTARALLQDPSGKSYIVGSGTRIGKNEGRVIDIDDNLLVVKETYVDFLGQETTKDIELRIRRSEGG
jgi:Tfp pilus assembly protein PilP